MKIDTFWMPEQIEAATEDPNPWVIEADRGWPPSETLLGYRESFDLFRAGEPEHAVELLRDLVGKPLILAPDSVFDDIHVYSLYGIGRGHALTELFHRIYRHCVNYASSLDKEGQPKEALQVLALLARLSSEFACAEPADVMRMAMATSIRDAALGEIIEMLCRLGDIAGSEIASRCQSEAKAFRKAHLMPFMKSSVERIQRATRWPLSWFPGRSMRALRRELEDTRQFARLWSESLDNAECQAFLTRLHSGSDASESEGLD